MAPLRFIVRDVFVLTATVTLLVLDAGLRAAPAPTTLSAAVGVVAGVLVALSGFLVHEWGHLLGARLSASAVHFPSRIAAPLLFHFDVTKNTRAQFLAMSMGGFIATLFAVAAVVRIADRSAWSGRTALVLTVVGVIVTFVLELPVAYRVWRGGELPDGFAFRKPE